MSEILYVTGKGHTVTLKEKHKLNDIIYLENEKYKVVGIESYGDSLNKTYIIKKLKDINKVIAEIESINKVIAEIESINKVIAEIESKNETSAEWRKQYGLEKAAAENIKNIIQKQFVYTAFKVINVDIISPEAYSILLKDQLEEATIIPKELDELYIVEQSTKHFVLTGKYLNNLFICEVTDENKD